MTKLLVNEVLDKIIGEAAELIHAATKIKDYGLYSSWEDGPSNRDAFVQELGDLMEYVSMLSHTELTITEDELLEAMYVKAEKIRIFHPHLVVE